MPSARQSRRSSVVPSKSAVEVTGFGVSASCLILIPSVAMSTRGALANAAPNVTGFDLRVPEPVPVR